MKSVENSRHYDELGSKTIGNGFKNDDEQSARECFFFGYLPSRPAELRDIALRSKILFLVRFVLVAARGGGGGGGMEV